jgi:hypothetical protein
MPRHVISDASEWIDEIHTVLTYYVAKPQPREQPWDNQRGPDGNRERFGCSHGHLMIPFSESLGIPMIPYLGSLGIPVIPY